MGELAITIPNNLKSKRRIATLFDELRALDSPKKMLLERKNFRLYLANWEPDEKVKIKIDYNSLEERILESEINENGDLQLSPSDSELFFECCLLVLAASCEIEMERFGRLDEIDGFLFAALRYRLEMDGVNESSEFDEDLFDFNLN